MGIRSLVYIKRGCANYYFVRKEYVVANLQNQQNVDYSVYILLVLWIGYRILFLYKLIQFAYPPVTVDWLPHVVSPHTVHIPP